MNTPLPPPQPFPAPPPPLIPQSDIHFHPKWCGVFSLRFGTILSCIIWASFSMYLAVMSFKHQNIFFTYLTRSSAPTIVFGVVNLILALVSTAGILVLISNRRERVITLSHSIWVSTALVLISAFANLVVYFKDPDNYIVTQCVIDSGSRLNQALVQLSNSTLNITDDFYHCTNLREDEIKFGTVLFILMFSFYNYWALCLYRYRYTPTEIGGPFDFNYFEEPYQPPVPMEGVPMPGGLNHPNFVPNDRATIVLTNQKPS